MKQAKRRISAFVLGPALERAEKVNRHLSSIQLDLEGQHRFTKLMSNPPKPTEAMRQLGALPDFEGCPAVIKE